MRLTAEQIAVALGAKKPSGRGHWQVCCPAHDEKTPSFRISEKGDRVLFKCFAGCSQESIIRELRSRGLWGQPSFKQQQAMVQRERAKERERMAVLKHIVDADRKSGRSALWSDEDRKKAAMVDRMFPKGAPPINLGDGWVMTA